MRKLRIGTRKSALAMWQTKHVAGLLEKAGIASEIVSLETKGDKILDVTISKIGSKGVFTEEIEELLLNKEIDLAVHSAKDLQSDLPEPFEILAFLKREKVNDALVSNNPHLNLDNQSDFTIGTSSTRRVALLKRYYPLVRTVDMRGNVQTRIRKMKEGHCDALVLAYAGVHRMEFDDLIAQELPSSLFTPAVGQGSIAVECSKEVDPSMKTKLKEILTHDTTEICIRAERSFLKTFQGGCSIPIFGLAQMDEQKLKLIGGIISLDGSKEIRHEALAAINEGEKLGAKLAKKILSEGGKEILDDIKKYL